MSRHRIASLLALTLGAAGRLGAQGFTLSGMPTLRIGNESSPEYQFNRIQHLRRLSDGRIVVTMGPDIRFFNASGTYLGKAGGRGQGPGEFQSINSFIVMPGDSLLTLNQRTIVVLDPQGTFVRQSQPDLSPLAAGEWFSEGAVLLPNGNILAPQYAREGSKPPTNGPVFRPRLRYSLLDVKTGTVTPLHTSGGIAQQYVNGRPYVMAFSPHAQQAVGSDRLYVGDNDSTRIHVFSLSGQPLGSITVADKATPFTAADRKAYEQRVRGQPAASPAARQQTETFLANAPWPTRYPHWGTALVDRSGALWVSAPAREGVSQLIWTAYGRDGRQLGSFTTPLRFTVKEIGGDYVLGVQRDEDGVETIAMYSLRRPR